MEDKTLSEDFVSGTLLPDDFDDNDFVLDGSNPGLGNIDDAVGEDDYEDGELGDGDADPNPADEGDPGTDSVEGEEGESEEGDENEPYLRARYWQEDGFLSKDVTLNKDMTQLDLENLYKEQIKLNAYNQIKTEIGDAIQAKGVNPNEIFETESEDHYLQKQYSNIATWTFDTILAKDDKIPVADTIRTLANEYWISKTNNSLDAEELEILVNKDLDGSTEEDLFNNKYKPYFTNQAKALATKIKAEADDRAKAEREQAANDLQVINEFLDKTGYTPEIKQKVKDALFKKDQTYDDGKGRRKVGITLFDKRRLEAGTSIKSQLQMALGIVLGSDFVDVKESTKRAAAVDTLAALARFGGKGGKQQQSQSQNKKTKTSTQQEIEELLLND